MTVYSPSIAVADATHRLVWVEGRDAVPFLDGQLTQHVAAIPPGAVHRSLLLEPRGKLRAILWVITAGDAVGLLTPTSTGAGVVAALERFRFRVAAAVRLDPRPVHTVWPGGAPGWREEEGSLRVTPPVGGYELVVSAEPPAGAGIGDAEHDRRRILAGEPWFGRDVDDSTIPQETGLVDQAVSFTKGCYLGQELVARIDSRGHVNRRLCRLTGAGPAPSPGDVALGQGGDPAGSLGSVATHGEGWVALAVLRREVGDGAKVTVPGAGSAVVTDLCASHSSNDPAPSSGDGR